MTAEHASLTEFISTVIGEEPLRVEESLGGGFVRLRVSEAERRQAKHDIRSSEDVVIELLRNSRDAGATNIYLATVREGATRTIVCIDDGSGVPRDMRERIFEARVTSKLDSMRIDQWGVHGRGMALFSIKQNATSARVVESLPMGGSCLLVELDCTSLSERADQSTWPQVKPSNEGGYVSTKGPHNIIRTVVDFALDSRPAIRVFFGSPAEIAATLYEHGSSAMGPRGRSAFDPAEPLSITMRLAAAQDARTLAEQSNLLGLAISERTAYRILNDELSPVSPVHIAVKGRHAVQDAAIDLAKDQRGLKVSSEDLERFTQDLAKTFETLGERYYLSLDGKPVVRVSKDAIHVTFAVSKDD